MKQHEQKKALWAVITADHPELARQLLAQRDRKSPTISIDAYNEKTCRWIRDAIRDDDGELERVVAGCEQVQEAFEGARISVPVAPLVDVLMKSQGFEALSVRDE